MGFNPINHGIWCQSIKTSDLDLETPSTVSLHTHQKMPIFLVPEKVSSMRLNAYFQVSDVSIFLVVAMGFHGDFFTTNSY